MNLSADPAAPAISADEFRTSPEEDGWRTELVRGRMVREPAPGPAHGRLAARLAVRLGRFVENAASGVVLADTGFLLARDPDTVRAPDLSFVSNDRIPEQGYGAGFWRLGPDLAVEILSPSNTASDLQAKIGDYLAAGCHEIWVLDPAARSVVVYGADGRLRLLSADEELDGGALLPGFMLPLGELFG
jgi:Uma2 family endonuclease